jgi:hypothetical protein
VLKKFYVILASLHENVIELNAEKRSERGAILVAAPAFNPSKWRIDLIRLQSILRREGHCKWISSDHFDHLILDCNPS